MIQVNWWLGHWEKGLTAEHTLAVEGFGEWALVQKQDGVNNYTPEAANTKDLRVIEE